MVALQRERNHLLAQLADPGNSREEKASINALPAANNDGMAITFLEFVSVVGHG